MDFWKIVNKALDYTKKTFSPHYKFSSERLKAYLANSLLKNEIIDRLCVYFLSHSDFYISWEDLIEIYNYASDEVGSIETDDKLEDILLFLDEIGFLFPVIGTSNRWEHGPLYSPVPHKFFLGWDKHLIEIVQEEYLRNPERNIKKAREIIDYEEYKQDKKSKVERKKSIEDIKKEIKETTSKENIKKVAEERIFTIKEIFQMMRECKLKYNSMISEKVALYLIIKKLQKKAPRCKYIKNNGEQCQKNIWDTSRFCHHHRFLSKQV